MPTLSGEAARYDFNREMLMGAKKEMVATFYEIPTIKTKAYRLF